MLLEFVKINPSAGVPAGSDELTAAELLNHTRFNAA